MFQSRPQPTRHTLRRLTSAGDTAISWDPAAEASDAIREAERIFEQERSRGSSIFQVIEGQPAVRLDRFDPQVQEMIVVPRMAGG